jgi:hypothetical protein
MWAFVQALAGLGMFGGYAHLDATAIVIIGLILLGSTLCLHADLRDLAIRKDRSREWRWMALFGFAGVLFVCCLPTAVERRGFPIEPARK